MKFTIVIYEDDGKTEIVRLEDVPENAKATYQIDHQEVIIENIVTPPTT